LPATRQLQRQGGVDLLDEDDDARAVTRDLDIPEDVAALPGWVGAGFRATEQVGSAA
jgi:hypothetical protein